MEKDYRLFVKNLPLNIDDDGLKEIFHKFVTIKKIDLKEKKDLNNKINKFAFINVSSTDKALHECFGQVNGERFDGFEISVELAKESFLDRLKREREESNQKKEAPKDYTNSFAFESLTSTQVSHKKFDDVDFSSKEFEVEKVKKKRKSSINDAVDVKVEPVQAFEDVEYKTKDFEEPCDSFKVEKTNNVNNFYADDTESSNVHRKKAKKAKEFNNNKSVKHSVPEKPVSESEKKRLMSLKEKKKVFKAQEKILRNAFKSVDDTKLNTKIVFDDDIDIESPKEITQKSSKQNNPLFESENEEEEEYEWNEEELEAKASTKQKLLKMQTSIGNDKRFVLDERFVDDDDEGNVKESKNSEENNDADFDEKKWQMGILEQVLGHPVRAPIATSSDNVQPKKKMIRYDPTANDHEKYEVTVEKPKQEKRKKKKQKNVEEEVKNEVAPLPTSSEIYYDVATNFADSFKPTNEGFSLLKTCGRDEVPVKREAEFVKEPETNGDGFSFSLTGRNPFRHDSDNEGKDETGENDYTFKLNSKTSEDDDKLFTPLGDSRIEELNKFFNTPSTVDEEAFKRRRRELKKIVRTKIRNNVKKATPWNKKRVRREKKKQR